MRNKTNHAPLTRGSRLTDAKLLLIITICVFAVMYVCAVLFLGSGFKKPQTFFNILNENAALLILSCGMSLVMITGGIGTAFGLVQGFLIAYLEIQPFIVTLAGMFFAKGMTTIVNATQFNVENAAFKALKETRIYVPGMGSVNKLGAYVPAYVEIGVVVALVVVAVLFVVLRWTKSCPCSKRKDTGRIEEKVCAELSDISVKNKRRPFFSTGWRNWNIAVTIRRGSPCATAARKRWSSKPRGD